MEDFDMLQKIEKTITCLNQAAQLIQLKSQKVEYKSVIIFTQPDEVKQSLSPVIKDLCKEAFKASDEIFTALDVK